jgi:lipoprotein-anchoring transpeptidase ErfK/SrfK
MNRSCLRVDSISTLALVCALLLLPTPLWARAIVHLGGYSAGTIVIKTNQRRLYYFVSSDTAILYPVGVGRAGMAWSGTAHIDGMYIKPAWSPPDMIRRENPRIPNVISSGSSANPMGAAAMTLSGGGQYAIHGTNNPGSIGGFVSHGCIRMYNSDILDLYGRVGLGTKVVVLP